MADDWIPTRHHRWLRRVDPEHPRTHGRRQLQQLWLHPRGRHDWRPVGTVPEVREGEE